MSDGDYIDMADDAFMALLKNMLKKSFDAAYKDDHFTSFYELTYKYMIARETIFESKNKFYSYLKRLTQIHFYQQIHNNHRRDKRMITESKAVSGLITGHIQSGSTKAVMSQGFEFYGHPRFSDGGHTEKNFAIAHDLAMMLSRLSDDDRALIDLVSHDLKYTDIADLMGWKDNTTFTRIMRLKHKLREIWIEVYA
jgi:DNA-directed RNA polymerase specialized sigma24 family protein